MKYVVPFWWIIRNKHQFPANIIHQKGTKNLSFHWKAAPSCAPNGPRTAKCRWCPSVSELIIFLRMISHQFAAFNGNFVLYILNIYNYIYLFNVYIIYVITSLRNICRCIYICIHSGIHIHMCICVYICIYIYTYIHT